MQRTVYSLFILLSFFLTGCGTASIHKSVYDPYLTLRKNIQSVLSDSLFIPSHASVFVTSLADSTVFFEQNSKRLMNPASNMKLFTSAAALSILDTPYILKTSVLSGSFPSNGVIGGDLYLKGYGDPDLTTADLDSLADFLHKSGVSGIGGNIVVDDSFFDDIPWGAGWMWDDDLDPDAPYINALSINKNCVRVLFISDTKTVYPYIEPHINFLTVMNSVRLTPDSVRIPLTIKRVHAVRDPNTVAAEGEMLPNSQIKRKIAIRNPDYYTGILFKESLLKAGISVGGTIVKNQIPADLVELTRFERPMGEMINNLNKISDNLSAENTLKILGTKFLGEPGTSHNGLLHVKQFLTSIGIDTAQLVIVDGSGVSRYNLVTAEQIVHVLKAMHRNTRIFPMFYHSLPIAGSDGTLAKRMTTSPAAWKVRAKTGTLNGVSCLSGYVQTQDEEMLAFSIMMQNFNTSVDGYRLAQDRICGFLAGFSRRMQPAQ